MSSGNWGALQIPPGVVATATKKMNSSNYSEVNAVRWIEGQLQPIGGQQILGYSFASRCRFIHPWFDLNGVYHIAYLCEENCYVDTGGVLTEITPAGGFAGSPTLGSGYGAGLYGEGLYGQDPRPGAGVPALPTNLPDTYSMDNFGAVLLVMASHDGRLLEWDPALGPGNLLVPTSGAPPGRCFVVTADEFVMIFGMGGTGGSPWRFGWCDQGDRTDWDFESVTNQAGFYDIQPSSPIVTAIAGRAGWAVFFTAKKAYVSRYLGLPFVYDYEELADDCTPWSPLSITTTSALILWMSQQGLFSFDGTSVTPVACQIRPWITNDIDLVNVRWQAHAAHLGHMNEFWWFFPQNGQPYNTRAAIYNYKEGWWSQCQMPRSAGITASYTAPPIFADGTQPFIHESGQIYNDCALPYADTFDLNLSSGGRLTTFKQLLPDIDGPSANLTFSLFYKMSRSDKDIELVSAPASINSRGYVDFRTTGRDMRLRMAVVGPQVPLFTLGQHLVDVVPRGDR